MRTRQKPGPSSVSQLAEEKRVAYKVPKQVVFMDELPKSTVGKVMGRKLREMEMERAKKKVSVTE